jgi:hypothetical protein
MMPASARRLKLCELSPGIMKVSGNEHRITRNAERLSCGTLQRHLEPLGAPRPRGAPVLFQFTLRLNVSVELAQPSVTVIWMFE